MLRAFATASGLALMSGLAASAQQAATPPLALGSTVGTGFQSPVLTIKQQELFEQSAFGRAALARLAESLAQITAENRQIEAGLEAEERDLTTRRETMTPEEFRPLAEAFDQKVEAIRNAQEAKSRDLNRQRDLDQQKFFEVAVPILADLMREAGAVALMDQSAIVLSLDRIDITAEAMARIDALTENADDLPDGTPRGKP